MLIYFTSVRKWLKHDAKGQLDLSHRHLTNNQNLLNVQQQCSRTLHQAVLATLELKYHLVSVGLPAAEVSPLQVVSRAHLRISRLNESK